MGEREGEGAPAVPTAVPAPASLPAPAPADDDGGDDYSDDGYNDGESTRTASVVEISPVLTPSCVLLSGADTFHVTGMHTLSASAGC